MRIQLSDHFSYQKLLRFTIPSISMMLITAIYGVVDGLFISNCVGDNALSATNIIYPLAMIIGAFGFMLGTGGSAEVAKTLGQGDRDKANQYFSLLIYTIITIGAILSVFCIIFIHPIAILFGASDLLMQDTVVYGTVLISGSVAFMLQTSFQSFFVVAEKPQMGLFLSIAAGVTNMVLDFLFIYVFSWGVFGAALATVCGYLVGGIIPLFYFSRPNDSLLKLTKPQFYGKMLLKSCGNGSSEMMSNVSMSLINILFNLQMMRLVGEMGVAAICAIMYVNFVFISIFLGFVVGIAPLVSYHYGAQNHSELQNIYKKSLVVTGIAALVMTASAELLAEPLANIFVGYHPRLKELTVHGFRIFSLTYLVCGFNIFGSSFFTALCNGKLSATISFLRSLVFQGGLLLLFPLFWEVEGVWFSSVAAEFLAVLVTLSFLLWKRKQYHYA